MALSGRILIGLLLYLRQGQTQLTCEIYQKQLMTFAVVDEEVSFQCEYKCESTNKSVPLTKAISVTMLFYKGTRSNTLQQSTDSVHSKVTKKWNLTVKGTDYSGMYYCGGEAQSKTFQGRGTLLHVEASRRPQVLTYTITGISTVLAIYSVSVTAIVLVKGKTWSRCKSYWTGNVTKKKQSATESLGGHVPEDDNAYMTLRSPQESIYNRLHHAGNTGSSSTATTSPKGKRVEPAVAEADVYECVYEAY